MWENCSDLLSLASTWLVRLQSLVCLHQQEYKVLRKGLDAGLRKQQISNLFNSQEAWENISPLTAIEKFSGVVIGRYELNFTMIVRIFQMHQH